jgi:hypothetical protein
MSGIAWAYTTTMMPRQRLIADPGPFSPETREPRQLVILTSPNTRSVADEHCCQITVETWSTVRVSLSCTFHLYPQVSYSIMSAEADVKLNNFKGIFSLDGKVAVVTGGSRGLGLHAASGYVHRE